MSSPFFSILIPTRNRASLLQTAIQSVLQQDFDDFEIVISDNCSEDNTRQVVSDFNDKRIRYIRTEEFLPIADNFEAALNHAKGKYASFLPDDDAYSKSRLKKCYELIEESKTKLLLHKFGTIYYPAGDKRFNYPPNSLTIPWFSNKVVQTASQKVIDSMYSGIQSDYYARSTVMPHPIFYASFPLLVNAFYQVSIFDSLKKRVSRLLKTRSADTYLGVLFLNEIREYLYLDAPLTITTVHASQTTNVAMSNIMGNKQNTPDNDPDLENVPYKELTERNVYANLLLEAIKEDPEGLGNNAALDWPAYYRVCYEDLLSMKNQGVEVSSKLEKLFQAIEKEPVELKNKILSGFAASENEKAFLNGKIKDVLRKIGQISPILSARLRLSNKSAFLFSRAFLLEGDKFEKNSLLDYSKMLDEEFIAKIAEIWLLKGKNMPREWVLK